MTRDIAQLTDRRFDLLVIGGGIHGLAVAYDAAQRGLATALIERGDFGGGSSFNHAKTVHGGLRSLQTGDIPKARFSMGERRAMARIAPNYVVPLSFMMATTSKLTRSTLALRIGFGLDALIGHDRNAAVVGRLHLPPGRVVGIEDYRATFGANASSTATGGARWCDYHMPESDRLTLAFAHGAVHHGAVLANYVEATEPIRKNGSLAGIRAMDRESGAALDIEARLIVNAAGAGCREWIAKLGGRLTYPLLKATNVVTTRPAGPLAMGAPTSGGRLLLIMPWRGNALIGTSHSEAPVEPGDAAVSAAELASFLDEINSAFPALRLTAADVSLVHRGVVPGERYRNGTLGLMGHHIIHDHRNDGTPGAVSVVGVKYTTGRGVAQAVVDLAMERLGRGRVSCQSGTTLLPGTFEQSAELEVAAAIRDARGLLTDATLAAVIHTHGTLWRTILDLCRQDEALREPIGDGPVPAAVVAHAVRAEMARTLLDVIVRRSNLGSAACPGEGVLEQCAAIMARELGWSRARTAEEVMAVRRFYAPVPA